MLPKNGLYSVNHIVSLTGRYEKKERPNRKKIDLENEDDLMALFKSVARGETLRDAPAPIKENSYYPLLKHPLPLNESKPIREALLQRILFVPLNEQAASAVIYDDAWVLEKVYMLGAPMNIADKNGYTPLHYAAQADKYDCVMVLCHIYKSTKSEINARTYFGDTALYLALASKAMRAAKILRENGGLANSVPKPVISGKTILDVSPTKEKHFLAAKDPFYITNLEEEIKMPSRYDEF